MIRKAGIINGIDFQLQPQLIHGHAAPLVIQNELGMGDQEILDAVRYHTTARGEMSILEQVVYLADLTSEDRHYPDVEETRRQTLSSLRNGMAYALTYTVTKLKALGQPICPDTLAAYSQYCGGTP